MKRITLDDIRLQLRSLKKLLSLKAETPDWKENDPNSPHYVKNRIGGYEETKEYTIFDGTLDEFELKTNGELTAYFTQIDLSAMGRPFDNESEFITAKFNVVFDGIEYTNMRINGSDGFFMLGNTGIIGEGTDTGEPFLLMGDMDNNCADWIIAIIDSSPSHTLKITTTKKQTVKIPQKYLNVPVVNTDRVIADVFERLRPLEFDNNRLDNYPVGGVYYVDSKKSVNLYESPILLYEITLKDPVQEIRLRPLNQNLKTRQLLLRYRFLVFASFIPASETSSGAHVSARLSVSNSISNAADEFVLLTDTIISSEHDSLKASFHILAPEDARMTKFFRFSFYDEFSRSFLMQNIVTENNITPGLTVNCLSSNPIPVGSWFRLYGIY